MPLKSIKAGLFMVLDTFQPVRGSFRLAERL